jgi:flavin reductase (DIM6/NTAB) family NADH-FMN oxidoreductase RutF
MEIDFGSLPSAARYGVLVQTVIPRPIAWILSENAEGTLNLAPFSYFSVVSSNPPTVAVSIGQRRDGSPKDTRANLLAKRPAVVHLGNLPLASALNTTAAALPPGESEIHASGIELEPFPGGPLPRIKGSRVAFHARYSHHLPLAGGAQDLILLELTHAYVDDAAITNAGDESRAPDIDAALLEPLARLGGNEYAELGRIFTLERPG